MVLGSDDEDRRQVAHVAGAAAALTAKAERAEEAQRRADAQQLLAAAPDSQQALQFGEGTAVNAAHTMKFSPFWKDNPVLWFAQAEVSIAISHITSDTTRFRYIVGAISTAFCFSHYSLSTRSLEVRSNHSEDHRIVRGD